MRAANEQVARLVKMSLAFHNLNKAVEGGLGLSLVQYHLLSHLKDMPGGSPQSLAKVVGMHPSTLTQSLKRLRKREFLFVGEDPRDSRKKMVTLTSAGKAAIDRFELGIEKLLRSESQLSQLVQIRSAGFSIENS